MCLQGCIRFCKGWVGFLGRQPEGGEKGAGRLTVCEV